MYKLLAIDMDGTLLNESKVITKHTKKVLKEAKEKGVKVVLSSGRPIEGLKKYLDELDLIEDNQYVLSYNGCLVQEVKSKKVIHEIGLCGKDLHEAYKLSQKIGVNIHAFSAKLGLITPKISKYTELEADLNGLNITEIDFMKIEEDHNIIKIMLIDEAPKLDEAAKKIPDEIYKKYSLVKSAPFFLEIINKNGNKGTGLEALGKYTNIKKEEMIAIGDASNDAEMIKYAGLGVAMENGMNQVKKIADEITNSNEEDGVANIVTKYILN